MVKKIPEQKHESASQTASVVRKNQEVERESAFSLSIFP